MAKSKTTAPKAKEKKYIVVFQDAELWVIGTRSDIIKDFNEDPEIYIDGAEHIKIYELGEPIPFTFVTPQIVL